MSRVIQLISHNQHLFALTDDGEIYVLRTEGLSRWLPVEGPLQPSPPRFSLPEEYAPVPKSRRPTSIGPDGNYIPSTGG